MGYLSSGEDHVQVGENTQPADAEAFIYHSHCTGIYHGKMHSALRRGSVRLRRQGGGRTGAADPDHQRGPQPVFPVCAGGIAVYDGIDSCPDDKPLQKSLVKQLKENRRGGKQTGLIMGRRLDAHALCRNDGKVFYKNSLPNEIPELAVGLLLDESGSMCASDRSTYARASAIILYDFCQSLDIPVMVYGHSTGYGTVELYSYAEFESFDHDDKYRMMDISARGSNRDGAALRFVAEQLSKRPETVKILILVSDGQPADSGYGGSAAEEDLRGIKQEYQRKGILFVAAAIGSDKENIERIYGDSFLDITDLNQLPTKLTNVVKRHIRV